MSNVHVLFFFAVFVWLFSTSNARDVHFGGAHWGILRLLSVLMVVVCAVHAVQLGQGLEPWPPVVEEVVIQV